MNPKQPLLQSTQTHPEDQPTAVSSRVHDNTKSEASGSSPPVKNSLSLGGMPLERVCFICLDTSNNHESIELRLVGCCSQCYAVSHIRCWKEWRVSQATHARRSRVAGNRVGTDPFLCSICKSGAARLRGEWVSLRWLHSFANFGDDRGPRVRFASGLFAALTGAREEARSRPEIEEESDDDFLEYIENQSENDRVSFLCGDTRKFILVFIAMVTALAGSLVTLNQWGVLHSSFSLMTSVVILLGIVGVLTTYVLVRYNRLLNSRSIT